MACARENPIDSIIITASSGGPATAAVRVSTSRARTQQTLRRSCGKHQRRGKVSVAHVREQPL